MPAFLGPLLGVFGKIAQGLVKVFPFLAAFFAGKKMAEAKVTKNNLEAKQKAEEEGQKVEDEIRDSSPGDFIRNNDI